MYYCFILRDIYLHFHGFFSLSTSTGCYFISNNTGLLTVQIKTTKRLNCQEGFFPATPTELQLGEPHPQPAALTQDPKGQGSSQRGPVFPTSP